MSFEVDIRAVGLESKSGDAIVLRYGDFSARENYRVVVIDGGFLDHGDDVVNHVLNFYKTDVVDIVISTHPDNDHISGLRNVLEKLQVKQLAMHRPWLSENSTKSIRKSLAVASELEEQALAKGIPIIEPFAGIALPDGSIHILGPSKEYYESLLPELEKSAPPSLTSLVISGVKKAMQVIREQWDKDSLLEPPTDAVSPINNSSVVLYANLGEESFLFTGDAGVDALVQAITYAQTQSIDLSQVKFIQVPHHGSKRNVGPSLLDQLFGPIVAKDTVTGRRAIISVAKDAAPSHPSKRVINALVRRGAKVFPTRGQSHHYFSGDIGLRPGWIHLTPEPFHELHEEEDQ